MSGNVHFRTSPMMCLLNTPLYRSEGLPWPGCRLYFMDPANYAKRNFVISAIVQHLEGKTVQYSNIGALTSEKHTEEDIAVLYSGLYKLLKLALRIPKTSLKQEVLYVSSSYISHKVYQSVSAIYCFFLIIYNFCYSCSNRIWQI